MRFCTPGHMLTHTAPMCTQAGLLETQIQRISRLNLDLLECLMRYSSQQIQVNGCKSWGGPLTTPQLSEFCSEKRPKTRFGTQTHGRP
jgi:hypothetical protein